MLELNQYRNPRWWSILAMASIITILLIMLSSMVAKAQCPEADQCSGAISIPSSTPTSFCNVNCSQDFYLNGNYQMPAMDNTVTTSVGTNFPCTIIHQDFWYQIEVTSGGPVCFQIDSNYQTDSLIIGNHGPLEGIEMSIYQGTTCAQAELLWGTQCYWMTTMGYTGTGDYDPTRQGWDLSVNLDPGSYFIQIDGWGWSTGCGTFEWCEPFFLGDERQEFWTEIVQKTVAIFPIDGVQLLEKSFDLESWSTDGISGNVDKSPADGWNYYRVNGQQYLSAFYYQRAPLSWNHFYDTAGRRVK